jgi:hypothetical protein
MATQIHAEMTLIYNPFGALEEYLKVIASCEPKFGPGQAILEFGCEFRASPISLNYFRRGPAKACFKNATAYAIVNDQFTYVEGYAMDLNVPIPLEHAWLIDSKGGVFDPTWRDACSNIYFGIPFKTWFLKEMLVKSDEKCGILSNHVLMRDHLSTADNIARGIASGFLTKCKGARAAQSVS